MTTEHPSPPHDRGHLLWSSDEGPQRLLLASFDRWLTSILGDDGINDLIFADGPSIQSEIIARDHGIIAGCAAIDYMVQIWCPDINISWKAGDGKSVKKGDTIAILKGSTTSLLKMERPMLNILGQLSGIATETHKWAKIAPRQIACTRKTIWGLLDKWAVHLGGGLTHRLTKIDAMMVKENDLTSLKMHGANHSERLINFLQSIDSLDVGAFLEVEVRTSKDAMIAAGTWKSLEREERLVIMLDNMKPSECKELSEEMEEYDLRQYVLLEASGGITINELNDWKDCKIDVLSTSALNRGTQPLDLTMLFIE